MKTYDVVVYGATGFTGRLVAHYLDKNGDGLRWAVAGRNPQKLAAIVDGLARKVDIVTADASDPASLAALANATQVVLTTVGPYAEYGMPLVDACAAAGTDYVDITGEPHFVRASIDKHHETAEKKGARIVHCCGFDSIPHDLGVLYAVSRLGTASEVSVRGYVRAGGTTFSGGTWQSALAAMHDRGAMRPLPLFGATGRSFATRASLHRAPAAHGAPRGWAVPLPTIDPQIVLRSASALPAYGQRFTYGHHAVLKNLSTLVGGAVVLGGVAALAQFGPTRQWLSDRRPSGQGPTQEQLDNGWFQATFVAEADGGRRVVSRVSGGEPGYRETAKMIAESALALVRDRERLPRRAGVLTTAIAFGETLITRLQRAGMTFEEISV